MNNFNLAWKLFSINSTKERFNFALIVPFLGIIIGVFLLLTTLGVMEGMEKTIYTDIQKFISTEKILINDLNKSQINALTTLLNKENINYFRILERKCLIKSGKEIRLINISAIDNLNFYIDKYFNIKINPTEEKPSIIIGSGLSNLLNTYESSTIELISPSDINLFTSVPPKNSFSVEQPYKFLLLDFDTNYGFISLKQGRKLFPNSGNYFLYFPDIIPDNVVNYINKIFPSLLIIGWEEDYRDLIESMKLEKILYSFFGILVVILSSFTLMNIMSNTIYRKIHQFGILKVIGFSQLHLQKLTLQYSLVVGIVSILIGILITFIFIEFNAHFHIIQNLFKEMFIFEFPLYLDPVKVIITSIIGTIIVVLSGFYPTYSASKLKLINAVNYMK